MSLDLITTGVVALCVGAYAFASVNAAAFVAKARGLDIYSLGSGNPGASNVFRSLGRGAAATVYLVDMLKGAIPALVGLSFWNADVACFAGLCAVVGHCYPIFHGFRGGKGVSTGGGVTLAVAPIVLAISAVLFFVLVKATNTSSIGSLGAVLVTLPAAAAVGVRGWALVWLGAISVLVVFRHRSNISRLMGGSEHTVMTE